MPWNFPFYQVIGFAVPALMAGNTESQNMHQTYKVVHQPLRKLLKAGFPEGALVI
jgi:succinate-semialdehyde dehydrogenase/glutarate-semialdehyde dehydrogenase